MPNGRDKLHRIFLMLNGDVAEVVREWTNSDGTCWIHVETESANGIRRSEQWLASIFLSLIDKDITPDPD